MKKVMLIMLFLFFAFLPQAEARKGVVSQTLSDSVGVEIRGYTFSSPVTTDMVSVGPNTGYATLVVDVTSGTIDSITYEVSFDGTNWYTPYTTDGTSLTSAGSVVTDNFTADRWIILTARLANYIRFTITPSGSTVIRADLIYQGEYQ